MVEAPSLRLAHETRGSDEDAGSDSALVNLPARPMGGGDPAPAMRRA